MRYQVPQFLEVEDKIFGPFTLKQFLYTVGGTAFAFIIWRLLPPSIAYIFALPILLFFVGLAFWKINDRPMIYAVESGLKYFFGQKLYIWKKEEKTPTKKAQEVLSNKVAVPKLSESKLKDLAWGLDIHETLTPKSSQSTPTNSHGIPLNS